MPGGGRFASGVTVSSRPPELAGAEEMVGLFINTLPVVDGVMQRTVGAWLRELQNRNLASREFGATPSTRSSAWQGARTAVV